MGLGGNFFLSSDIVSSCLVSRVLLESSTAVGGNAVEKYRDSKSGGYFRCSDGGRSSCFFECKLIKIKIVGQWVESRSHRVMIQDKTASAQRAQLGSCWGDSRPSSDTQDGSWMGDEVLGGEKSGEDRRRRHPTHPRFRAVLFLISKNVSVMSDRSSQLLVDALILEQTGECKPLLPVPRQRRTPCDVSSSRSGR